MTLSLMKFTLSEVKGSAQTFVLAYNSQNSTPLQGQIHLQTAFRDFLKIIQGRTFRPAKITFSDL